MKKLIKITLLPGILLILFFGAFMFVPISCSPKSGEKCSSCTDNADCTGDLKCFSFSDGKKRCANSSGDLCSKI